jgi:superfamily II DNA/RNA helicase
MSQSPQFDLLYRKLLRADIAGQLPGVAAIDFEPLSDNEIRQLIGVASIFSISQLNNERAQAYEIATRLIELNGADKPNLMAAADIILSRIGNFPGRQLLRNRYSTTPDVAPQAPPWLWLERAAREIENSVTHSDGTQTPLTDFQFDLYEALDNSSSVSVSAPTSAGKSFVMGMDLVRRLTKGVPACVVYLVPTRALIHEVTFKLRENLRKVGLCNIPIRSVPFPIAPDKAPQGAVYVLTQERLMSLLHSQNGTAWITTLIVDEAQGIQDDARGIILQSSIEAVIRRFPNAEVHFASPLIKNPEYLLNLFGKSVSGKAITETLSPVSQNLILISEVYKHPKQVQCELLLNQERVDLGVFNLKFRFRDGKYQQRASLAIAVTKEDEATILFANNPSDTEELAEALIANPPPELNIDNEIANFIDFLKSEIHTEYSLINTLPYGVAFHYGDMPAIVRSKIEKLFKKGALKYLCCTSTLLQGVNLPARHIIIENPKRGSGKSMYRKDFLNLAGRAGRLLHEFHGNVWCVRPADWDEHCYQGDSLQEIHSAMQDVMLDGGTAIQRLLSNESKPDEVNLAEAALGKVYCDYVSSGKNLLDSEYKTVANEAALEATSSKCQELQITLPIELLDFNRAMRPDRLQTLYDWLKLQDDLSEYIPIKPGMAESNERMKKIIQLVYNKFDGAENNSYVFYSWLAGQWIYNTPLKQIIAARLQKQRGNGDTRSTSTLIRELLHTLEKVVRFTLVKYYVAYTSILSLIYFERDDIAASESIEPFHVYLECGASDRVALNLIAIGLSRVTALAVYNKITFPQDSSPEDCFSKLSQMNLDNLNVPKLCIEEIRELLGS